MYTLPFEYNNYVTSKLHSVLNTFRCWTLLLFTLYSLLLTRTLWTCICETLMEYCPAELLVTAHQRKVGADLGNVHHT